MATYDERLYLALLRSLPGLGPQRVTTLVQSFGSGRRAWQSFGAPWLQLPGFSHRALARWRPYHQNRTPSALQQELEQHEIVLLTPGDRGYPASLAVLAYPPPVLYAAGNLACLQRPMVTIVGTRKSTPGGRRLAVRFGLDLARAGVTVVSGLAYGIDGAAHRGALAGGGCTAAVMACGLDRIYPRQHVKLAGDIRRRGVLLSEYGPGVWVEPGRLRARNRIMAALGSITVVVEAGLRSGTMITVRHALDYGRTVAAVPGSVGASSSRGCNNLIREGAHLVEEAADILSLLGWPHCAATGRSQGNPGAGQDGGAPRGNLQQLTLTGAERTLYALLDVGLVSQDELQARSGLHAGQVSAALLRLELRGLVYSPGSGLFARTN